MGYVNPLAFTIAVIPLGMAVYYFLRGRNPKSGVLPLSGPQALIAKEAKKTRLIFRTLFAMTLLGLFGIIYVIARPYQLRPIIKKTGEGIDIVVLLDVSESMDADDFLPSRIDVAKSVIRDFIKRRSEDREQR